MNNSKIYKYWNISKTQKPHFAFEQHMIIIIFIYLFSSLFLLGVSYSHCNSFVAKYASNICKKETYITT